MKIDTEIENEITSSFTLTIYGVDGDPNSISRNSLWHIGHERYDNNIVIDIVLNSPNLQYDVNKWQRDFEEVPTDILVHVQIILELPGQLLISLRIHDIPYA